MGVFTTIYFREMEKKKKKKKTFEMDTFMAMEKKKLIWTYLSDYYVCTNAKGLIV